MLKESQFNSLIDSWRYVNPQRRKQELVTLWAETSGEVDIYNLYFDEILDKLIDPVTNIPAEDFFDKGTTPVNRSEYISWLKMEDAVRKNKEVVLFWVSPPHIERSADTKITVWFSREEKGKKSLVGKSARFDLPAMKSMDIANNFMTYSIEPFKTFSNLTQVRENIIILSNPDSWLTALKAVLGNKKPINKMASGQDIVEYNLRSKEAESYNTMIDSDVNNSLIFEHMRASSFLGKGDITCPVSVSNFLLARSLAGNSEGKFVRKCGQCGATINSVISRGFQCPSCGGTYEGC